LFSEAGENGASYRDGELDPSSVQRQLSSSVSRMKPKRAKGLADRQFKQDQSEAHSIQARGR
jgi:hypothetical protein